MAVEDPADAHGGGPRDSPGHHQFLILLQNQGAASGEIADGYFIAQLLQPQGGPAGNGQGRVVAEETAAGGRSQVAALHVQTADAAQNQIVIQVGTAAVIYLGQVVRHTGVAGDLPHLALVEVEGHIPADLEVPWVWKGRVDLTRIIEPVVRGCIGFQGPAGVEFADCVTRDTLFNGDGGIPGKLIVFAARGDAARRAQRGCVFSCFLSI